MATSTSTKAPEGTNRGIRRSREDDGNPGKPTLFVQVNSDDVDPCLCTKGYHFPGSGRRSQTPSYGLNFLKRAWQSRLTLTEVLLSQVKSSTDSTSTCHLRTKRHLLDVAHVLQPPGVQYGLVAHLPQLLPRLVAPSPHGAERNDRLRLVGKQIRRLLVQRRSV